MVIKLWFCSSTNSKYGTCQHFIFKKTTFHRKVLVRLDYIALLQDKNEDRYIHRERKENPYIGVRYSYKQNIF